jgi:hypothetical protein
LKQRLRVQLLVLAAVALLAGGFFDGHARAAPAYGCAPELASLDFPEPRVCVEAQAWWMQGNTSLSAPGASFARDATHVHTMTPYPHGERVFLPPAGQGFAWHVLSIFHNDIGGVTRGVRGGGFQDRGGSCCPLAPGSSGLQITTNDQRLRTTHFTPADVVNGWRTQTGVGESRITTDTTSRFGARQFTSSRYFTDLNQPAAPKILKARGWYACGDYVDAQLNTKTRASTLANGTAIKPGQTLSYSIGAGALWAFAYIDPDLHAGSKGTVLFENRTGSSGSFIVPPLTPGPHVLMIGGWEKIAGCGGGWNAGVLRVPFQVS